MKKIAFGVVALIGLGGCMSGEPTNTGTLKLQGTVPAGTRHIDNARAVAVTRAGKSYWSYLDQSGDFTLTVPAGQAYRVLIASALPTGGRNIVGHVAIETSKGTSTWLGVHQGGTLDLGSLRVNTALGGGMKPQDEGGSSGASGSDDHHSDDFDCKEDDNEHDELCEESGGDAEDSDVELHADNDPKDKCIDDFKGSAGSAESSSSDGQGGDASDGEGGDSSSGDSEGHDGEHDQVCAPPSGGGTGGGGTGGGGATPPPPAPPGGPGTCNVTADCGALQACIASTCTTVVPR